ncbi:MAG: CHAD domain-containing protein, partial [Candidatus Limnocylindria bacterium]
MHEREIKLSLPGHFDLPPLSLDGEALTVQPLPDLSLRASYHDTDDLRLARHGVTLRHRTGEPDGPRWTLKLPRAATLAGQVERDEIHFAGDRREIPLSARELVTAYTRGGELRPVATLRTRRRRWLLGANGTDLAELADDEVAVVEGRRVVARFRELELEAHTDDAPLAAIADQLLSAGATHAEPVPKVVRALGSRATAAPDVAVPELAPDASARELVGAAISDALVRIMANDAAARLGFDEGIHQLRVAFRRLRSDLRTFRLLLEPEWVAHIGPMLREHGRRLGSVRDLDVLQARLRADADGLDHALDPLWRDLAERRRESFEALAAALRDPGYVALLYELVAAVGRPPVTPAADGAAAGVGVGLARDAWKRLKRQADALQ